MASAWDFDVAVIGGGPGGSSAATALARRGRTVLLLERDRFPRFHIGESQLPWSNEVFRALGVHDAIVEAGFVKKWGASFRTVDGATEQYADFQFAAETPSPQTFQVPRATFDEVLLRHSERSGAKVLEEHRALDAAFEPDGVVLRFVGPDGTEQAVRVGFVVDASGRTGFLTKKLGRHEFDPVLRNIAVHAQYEGIPRLEGRRAGDIRMFTRADMGWIWLIPISQSVTSVGAVIPQSVHRRESKAVPEDKYSWRPMEGVRSFGEVFMHMAGSTLLFGSMTGMKIPDGPAHDLATVYMKKGFEMPELFAAEAAVKDKAKILEIMEQSFQIGRDMIRNMPDADLDKSFSFFGRPMTQRGLLIFMGNHLNQHVGQSIAYARVNHIVPPWSQPKPK